jgi:putative Holliday junction resolvase
MEEKRILCMDYGRKRVGIAIGDPLGMIATPLMTIERTQVEEELTKLIEEYSIELIVIGNPVRTDGVVGKRENEVKEFARFIERTFSIRVKLWDERYSTQEAERYMRDMEEKPSRDKGKVDRIAATLILQSYLDYRNQKKEL